MVKLYLVVCTLGVLVSSSICGSNSPTSAAVQAPVSVDCSKIIYDVADCISFVSRGSKEAKPTTSCCSGFISVLKSEPKCICEAFESTVQLGIEVDIDKAKILPRACGASSDPMHECGISMTPASEPVASIAKPPKSHAPAPSTHSPVSPPNKKDPAPAPSTVGKPSPLPPNKKAPAPAPLTEGTPSQSPPKKKTPAPVPSTGETPGPSPPKKKTPAPAPSITKTPTSSPIINKAPAPSPNSSNSGAYLLPATSGVAILVLIASAFFF